MATALRLKTYTEIIARMFSTVRTLLGMGADLNRGSLLRTTLEAAALQDAEQYVQVGRLMDLFSIDTCFGEDLDRRVQDFGLVFNEELSRFGAMTSIDDVVIGDSNLQTATGVVEADASAGDTSFTVFQLASPNDFITKAGSAVFMLKVGRADLGQQEIVLVSAVIGATPTELVCTILSPLTGFQFLHRAGERVRLSATASQLQGSILSGATTATVTTGTGSTFTGSHVILDRDVPSLREILAVSSVVGDTLNFSTPTAFAHSTGATVIKSTTGSDRALGSGLVVFVPISTGTQEVDFTTTAAATLLDGDRETDAIPVESNLPGAGTRAASYSITGFQSKPFPTATVTNPDSCIRGRDRESDTQYKIRVKKLLQSLSRSTKQAIESRVVGLLDPTSQLTVESAQVQEPIGYGISNLYITDGSASFSIQTQVVNGRKVLISDAVSGDRRARLPGSPSYGFVFDPLNPQNSTPRLFASLDRGTSTSVAANSLTDTGRGSAFPGGYVGYWVKAADDQFYQITGAAGFTLTLAASGATPASGDYAIFNLNANPLKPSVVNPPQNNEDYVFDPTTGDLELTQANALTNKDSLIVADDTRPDLGCYTQTTGLGSFVQKVVNGDPSDFQNFPGIKAAGTQVYVKAPNIIIPTINIQVTPVAGFTVDQLSATVASTVELVVNAAGMGQDVLITDIIVAVKAITGVSDVKVLTPTNNITAQENELVRVTSDNITVV